MRTDPPSRLYPYAPKIRFYVIRRERETDNGTVLETLGMLDHVFHLATKHPRSFDTLHAAKYWWRKMGHGYPSDHKYFVYGPRGGVYQLLETEI